MKISISKYEKKYEFELESVVQMCGQNMQVKSYIFESLRRYFGGYKYSESKNPWRDNVAIDGEQKGRKYFQVISIADREQLIGLLNLSKQSYILKYIQALLNDFEYQKEMEIISQQLDTAFINLNERMREIGPIEIGYKSSQLWDIIQKSEIYATDERDLHDLSNCELIQTFLNTIEKELSTGAENYLILLPNLDHLVNKSEYVTVYSKLEELNYKYGCYSIIGISLDGYTFMHKQNLSNICVCGEEMFLFPEFEKFKTSIENTYPVQRNFEEIELISILKRGIQKIGSRDYLVSDETNVVCKIINKSLMIEDKMKSCQNRCIDSFLES